MFAPVAGALAARFARLPATTRGAIFMIGSAAGFAVMMAVVRYTSRDLHPFEVAFFRNLFGAIFMLPWIVRVGRDSMTTARIGMHAVRSLIGLASMLTFFTALSLLPLAEVTALTFTMPLFTTLGAALFLRETVKARRWSATLVGLVGALIILRPGVEALRPEAFVALAAAALMAGAYLTVKSLARTEHPNTIVLMMGLLMTPMSLVPALFVWKMPDPHAWAWLVAMGLAATFAQVSLTRAFAAADASAVLPFDFSRLVFVAILGYVLFGERPDVWTWVGAGVIVASSAYIAHREAAIGREPPHSHSHPP
ncbi:MAG: DMT family transporter [Rhodospirillales bacterium]|nr:DMT family transporter [Rhodospirillales bacterium]